MVIDPKRIVAAGTAVIGAGAAALALAGPAAASTPATESASANWAGYVAGNANFSSVSGSWVQPSASCSSGQSYSAFWVGLGGASSDSQALEQVGTQADCSSTGAASYYAWYELVPSAPVKLDLAVSPGDRMSAKVSVSGSTVTVSLSNRTTGKSVTKTLQASSVDTSSAEWIAEAPSSCTQGGSCTPLPLADFGTVTFSDATATAGGQTKAISGWTSQAVELSGGSGVPSFGAHGVAYAPGAGAPGSAQTSSLTGHGAAFTVSYVSGGGSAQTTSGGYGGPGGYGDGYGGGYAYGPDGGYGAPGYAAGGGYGYGVPGSSYGGYGGYGGGYADSAAGDGGAGAIAVIGF